MSVFLSFYYTLLYIFLSTKFPHHSMVIYNIESLAKVAINIFTSFSPAGKKNVHPILCTKWISNFFQFEKVFFPKKKNYSLTSCMVYGRGDSSPLCTMFQLIKVIDRFRAFQTLTITLDVLSEGQVVVFRR